MIVRRWKHEREGAVRDAHKRIGALLAGLDGPDRARALAAIRAEAHILLLAATVLEQAEKKR